MQVRWTESGPIIYAYVGNDPLGLTDESGLCPACVVGSSGAGLGGALSLGGALGAGGAYSGQSHPDSDWDNSADTASASINDPNSNRPVRPDQRQSDYARAKGFCDTPPPPGDNDCSTLSKQIDHAEMCVNLYESWDDKYLPGRHSQKIQEWKQRINKLKNEHNRNCSQKCQE